MAMMPVEASGPRSLEMPPPPLPKNSLDEVLDKMDLGNIVFSVPSKMTLDERKTITLVLSPDKSFQEIIISSFDKNESVESAQIKISDKMEAKLTGSGFNITEITPSQQVVSSKINTEWKWEVKPLESGRLNLYLAINAIVSVNNETSFRSLKTFSKIIEIDVKYTQRILSIFKSNWQWLWTTVLLPIGLYLWKKRKKTPEKKRIGFLNRIRMSFGKKEVDKDIKKDKDPQGL
jgi:hypothetical protein